MLKTVPSNKEKQESSTTNQHSGSLFHPPQVDKVLRQESLVELSKTIRRDLIAQTVRLVIEQMREESPPQSDIDICEAIALKAKGRLQELLAGGLRKVLNGTGVLLSTNLGRAPLSEFARKRLNEALSGYSNLEYDLDKGRRGERTEHISDLLALLTGAEAAIVVNNNASAVMLAVMALSSGKETVISRGELIEIGGSFRLPDVIVASGGILAEVGTTNRTRAGDYEKAICERTGLIMKCHRSNYQIVGFTEDTSAQELAAIGKKHKVPTVYDVGGGCFVDLSAFELAPEPTIQKTLQDGIDLVLFSGDKLLGGPQAGIIAGSKDYVAKLRKCPIYRALRADKVVIALLECALSQYLYVDGVAQLPVYKFAALKQNELLLRAKQLCSKLSAVNGLSSIAVELQSTMGGGSLPGETLASAGLALASKALSAARLAAKLRAGTTPIVSTVAEERVFIDLRTIDPEEDDLLINSIIEAIQPRT